jgi:hypothetical protein
MTRLYNQHGHRVPGIGFQTWCQLEHAGELQWRECASSSTWPSEWILKGVKG